MRNQNNILIYNGQEWRSIQPTNPKKKEAIEIKILLFESDPPYLSFLRAIKNIIGLKRLKVDIRNTSDPDKCILQNLATGVAHLKSLEKLEIIISYTICGGNDDLENVRNLTNCFSRNLQILKLKFGKLEKIQLDIILNGISNIQNLSYFKLLLTKDIDCDQLSISETISQLINLKTVKIDIICKKQSSRIYNGKNCSSFLTQCQIFIINVNFFQNLPLFNASENLRYLGLIFDKTSKELLHSFQEIHLKLLQTVDTLSLEVRILSKTNLDLVKVLLQNLSSLRQLKLIQTEQLADMSEIFPLVNQASKLQSLYLKYNEEYSNQFQLGGQQINNFKRMKHLRIKKTLTELDQKKIFKALRKFDYLLTLKVDLMKKNQLQDILKAKRLVVFGAKIQNNFRKININK